MQKATHENVGWCTILCVLIFAVPATLHSEEKSSKAVEHGVDGGELSGLFAADFVARYLPARAKGQTVRCIDFADGRSHSEAIEAALAARRDTKTPLTVVLDSQNWVIDRAILLPSHTELVIDGCTLKLANGVFDNTIRVAGIRPDASAPNGFCKVHPTIDIRITGRNRAVIEGADKPYAAKNPKTGSIAEWVGDFYGWRTIGILLSHTKGYELSGFTMRKTQCWAISQGQCSNGYLHDIVFDTRVKNGDGIDLRNGCSFILIENISGSTSDDTIAMTALNGDYFTPESNYVYPMQPEGLDFEDNAANIHDIAVKNISTGGRHHGVICLATSPRVYNISIENIVEEAPSRREAVVKIYTGYGSGYRQGNLHNIHVSKVVSRGARYAVMVKAGVKDVAFSDIRQFKQGASARLFEGLSENLTFTEALHLDAEQVDASKP